MKFSRSEDIVARRMRKRGLRNRDIAFFLRAWRNVSEKHSFLDWRNIKPVTEEQVLRSPDNASSRFRELQDLGIKNMHKCAIVKLNGGRATTMGGTVPKCMVSAKNGKSFLDIVMGQVMTTNDRYNVEMPLILMNSFFTDHVTEKIVGKIPLIIMNFIQNEYPRLREDNLMPMDTGTDDDWCPAGHGDFFSSLENAGFLDTLLEIGLRYLFISNIDNLSASFSPLILGQMIANGHDFLMEVTRKTTKDIKGGAPVLNNSTLSLLEMSEVHKDNMSEFKDIERFRYFNTNNLWIDLRVLKNLLQGNRLQLPIIQNRKNIRNTNIIQIETAMGAGLQCFPEPGLLEVPRNRFTPVKKPEDLLVLQSDLYILNTEYQLQRNPEKGLALAV